VIVGDVGPDSDVCGYGDVTQISLHYEAELAEGRAERIEVPADGFTDAEAGISPIADCPIDAAACFFRHTERALF
jgi:hypothetical protein